MRQAQGSNEYLSSCSSYWKAKASFHTEETSTMTFRRYAKLAFFDSLVPRINERKLCSLVEKRCVYFS